MNAFEQWVYAASMSTRMPSAGTLPSTAQGSSSARSVTSVARPFTRNVSPTPGMTKSRPTRGFTRMLRRLSAMRLPGRSGTSNVVSSRICTKPRGSPRGLTSRLPAASQVARQTSGDPVMNGRVSGFRRSLSLAHTISVGVPMSSRSAASVSIVCGVRRCPAMPQYAAITTTLVVELTAVRCAPSTAPPAPRDARVGRA